MRFSNGPTPEWIRQQQLAFQQFYADRPIKHARSLAASPGAATTALPERFEIPSSRDVRVKYNVALYESRAECNCDAFVKYRRGLECSHIRLAKEIQAELRRESQHG